LGNACDGVGGYGGYGGGYSGGYSGGYVRTVGSATDIPIDTIVSFVHSTLR
jgi:hypothetical protein